ncbi:MAGE family-domain-containing protein [Pterulicium gracile]|uniref:MAGE family-domain-containing protein n=1 Tax=Pterulicium gracile TaxID=1884261 RepID=A0A5C3QBG0_9AGAR|nr:MAGE family-domain-containing protein [Pterula gracilis]
MARASGSRATYGGGGGRSQRQSGAASQAPASSQAIQSSERNGRAAAGSRKGGFQRRPAVQEDSDEDMDGDGDGDGDEEDVEDVGKAGGDDTFRKASDVVRLALFMENKRMPLKRDDINKKILGGSRAFNAVFPQAQDVLQDVFGMHLVEMRTRAQLDRAFTGEAEDDGGKIGAGKKKASNAGSKTYALVSTLDPRLIEYASQFFDKVLDAEIEDQKAQGKDLADDDEDELYAGKRNYGSIIAWSKGDQLGSVGILYTILSLILVNGRSMPNDDLRAALKRLSLDPSDPVYLTPQSTTPQITTDLLLKSFRDHGYIDKIDISSDPRGGKGKRSRTAASGDGEADAAAEWRWGMRAEVEVGERKVARFLAEFMVGEQMMEEVARERGGDDDDEDEDGGEGDKKRRKRRAEMERRTEKMMVSIQTAVGGVLADAKE